MQTLLLRNPSRPVSLLLACALLLLPAAIVSAAPKAPVIMTSIKPLALIVKAITDESADIQILLPPNANPHHYQLTPSDRMQLKQVDLFVWVGPTMETFLTKVIAASQVKALALLQDTEPHEDEPPHKEHHEEHHEEHAGPHAHDIDPHLWLQPEEVITAARTLTSLLGDRFPHNAALYQRNLDQFVSELRQQDAVNRAALQSLKGVELITAHSVLEGFARHYQLHVAGAISRTPEQAPGARHLHSLHQQLKTAQAACIITERGNASRHAENLVQRHRGAVVEIDPLATLQPLTTKGYLDFLAKIQSDLQKCRL